MDSQARQAALEQAKVGDTSALGDLLESFRPYIRTLVRGYRGEQIQAQVDDSDMIQDALVEAHRSFHSFEGQTMAEFAGWLRTITLRTAARTARNLVAGRQLSGATESGQQGQLDAVPDPGSTPSARAARQELTSRITDALARLPKVMQQVVLGRLVDGLPHADLAQRLGRSEAAVRVLYVWAIARLRQHCQDLGSGPPAT